MATVNLGNIKLNWKGAYNAGTAYVIDDVVSYNGSSYVCIDATTGNLPTVKKRGNQMSAAGTDGTDVGTTITTQGDILYRDGSGLQRLAAGTSGQVLQTGGTGANPSWGTVSSDFVKIVDVGGNGTSVQAFDSCFSSTYENYRIYASITTQNTTQVYMRMQNASNTEQTDGYYGAGHHSLRNSSGAGGSHMGFWNQSRFEVQENTDSDADRPAMYIIDVMSPFNSALKTWVNIRFGGYDTANFRTVTVAGQHDTAGSMAGFRFYTNSGNILSSSKFKIYGLK
jgi:hypothetical protein